MSTTLEETKAHGEHESHDVTVRVFAPSHVEPKQFTWPKTKKVGLAAAEAAKEFKVDVEAPTFQKGTVVLDREKTLAEDGVKDHNELELVSAGGGV